MKQLMSNSIPQSTFQKILPKVFFIRIFFNEINLLFRMYWYYKWSNFINAVMTAADFIWWMLLIDGGSLVSEKIAPLAVGYIIWSYANYIIYDAMYLIQEASQTGVLEQIYMSAIPLHIQLMARFISSLIICSLELAIVIGTLLLFCPVHIPISFAVLPPLLLTIIGIGGFALIVVGAGLLFKKVQSFTYMLSNLLLFLNGSILPLESMPEFIKFLSKTLPTTQGIIVLRNMIFKDQTIISTIADYSLILLAINSFFYLLIGMFIFKKCETIAQEKGILGHY